MKPEDITSLNPRDIATLRTIMAALRTPVSGCPWDLEQDFTSIAPYTIEEAYEVADVICSYNQSITRKWLLRKEALRSMMLSKP
jgi:NTP pyrophosphatase (non-canonical NTP hydrolase)